MKSQLCPSKQQVNNWAERALGKRGKEKEEPRRPSKEPFLVYHLSFLVQHQDNPTSVVAKREKNEGHGAPYLEHS